MPSPDLVCCLTARPPLPLLPACQSSLLIGGSAFSGKLVPSRDCLDVVAILEGGVVRLEVLGAVVKNLRCGVGGCVCVGGGGWRGGAPGGGCGAPGGAPPPLLLVQGLALQRHPGQAAARSHCPCHVPMLSPPRLLLLLGSPCSRVCVCVAGMRLGWVTAHPDIVDQMTMIIQVGGRRHK